MRELNADQVRAYMYEHETSMWDAKKALTKEILLEAVDNAGTLKDIREILKKLVDIAA